MTEKKRPDETEIVLGVAMPKKDERAELMAMGPRQPTKPSRQNETGKLPGGRPQGEKNE